jgi:hypothetical protein
MRTDGQTDATKLIVVFHIVTEELKNRAMADHNEIFIKTLSQTLRDVRPKIFSFELRPFIKWNMTSDNQTLVALLPCLPLAKKAVPWKGICFQVECSCSLGLTSRTVIRESSSSREIRLDPLHSYLPTSAIMAPLLCVRAALE